MTDTAGVTGRYTLWGGQLSVYTARVRSYLIKKRIPYRERYPSHPDFGGRIVPGLGFFVIPVLETPDGTILEDSSEIIDYLEERHPEPCFVPSTPVQRAVRPGLGQIRFPWRGVIMQRECFPQMLWHFSRVLAHARELQGDALARWNALRPGRGHDWHDGEHHQLPG